MPPNTFKHKIFFYLSTKATRDHFWFCFYAFFFLEGIYICIYLQPCWYLHSQEYSVRNTKVLRKKLLKISSRLQENYFHMVRPESPVLVVQRQLRIVLLLELRVQKSSEQQADLEKWGSGGGGGVNLGLPRPCQTPATQLLPRELSLCKIRPPWAVCPQNKSHFLGDQEVIQSYAFGIPERERNMTKGPTQVSLTLILCIHNETSECTSVWGSQVHKAGFENVKVGEDKVSLCHLSNESLK